MLVNLKTNLGHIMHCSMKAGLAMRFTPVLVGLTYLHAPFFWCAAACCGLLPAFFDNKSTNGTAMITNNVLSCSWAVLNEAPQR